MALEQVPSLDQKLNGSYQSVKDDSTVIVIPEASSNQRGRWSRALQVGLGDTTADLSCCSCFLHAHVWVVHLRLLQDVISIHQAGAAAAAAAGWPASAAADAHL